MRGEKKIKKTQQKHRDVKDMEEAEGKETLRSGAADDKAGSGWIHHTAGMCCSDTNFGPRAVGNEHTL